MWDEPEYRITLLYENGYRAIYGMTLTETPRLSLTDGLGGGIYAPYDEYEGYDESDEYDETDDEGTEEE